MQVSLFIPCLVDTLVPEVGDATVAVLEGLGLSLDYPQAQTCCGQPAYNAGHWSDARRVAEQFLRVFDGREWIVAPSGSCVSMVRNHYARLFADDPARLEAARRIGARTFELSEFLVQKLGVTEVAARFPHKVTVHDSCHLRRELGVQAEPRKLLKAAGAELVEMAEPERCCGFGGTFAVKFPEVSAAMARFKAEAVAASGAEAVVTCDPGCLLQMRGYLQREGSAARVMHLAEVLAHRA